MAEVLLTQLPELYAPLLLKEGVVHAIETLAAAPLETPHATPTSAALDSTPAAADGSASRRSTRGRSGAATATPSAAVDATVAAVTLAALFPRGAVHRL